MPKKINMVGKRYGRLVVMRESEKRMSNKIAYLCLCACGNRKTTLGQNLRNGRTKSCGCFNQEKRLSRTIHGDGGRINRSRLYVLWNNITQRCHNPKNPHYKKYGLKGIYVCDEWKNSYQKFKEWALKNGYSDYLSIDRKNSFGGYNPENCRFITLAENSSIGGVNRQRINKLQYLK